MSDYRTATNNSSNVSSSKMSVFADVEPTEEPTAIILVGGPGAVPARAVGRLLADSPARAAYVNRSDLMAVSGGLTGGDAGTEVSNAMRHAQRNKLPVVIDDEPTGAAPGDALATFKQAGFRTHLVVTTHRNVETAMARVTRRLLQQVSTESPSMDEASPAGWNEVAEVLSSVDRKLVDQVSVLDGDGELVYEGPARAAAWDAVRKSVRASMPGAQGVLWLAELRRITDYVTAAGSTVSTDDRKRVIDLYDVAERHVLPGLPIDPHSKSAVAQRDLLKRGRATIEGTIARAEQTTAMPQTPGSTERSRGL